MHRLKLFALAIVLVFPVFAIAQLADSTVIGNLAGRHITSLNGVWHFIVDPYNAGVGARFYENRKPRDKQELVEYDFDRSPVLNVPGDWNSQRDDLLYYDGTLWYERSFQYHKREHTRAFLNFEGANYRATVYLNGTKLGEHIGGYTPFNFEVTNALRDGDNFVVVEVNDARLPEAVPALSTDWWNYGGLTRDVSLVEVPDTFIQNYFVQLAKGKTGEVAASVQLNGATAPQQVTIAIPEAGINQTAQTDAKGLATFGFSANLTLWSPENPKLYRVVISSGADSVEDEIGFRTIEVRGTQILLNGKQVFLRGISLHEEAPFRSGRAVSREDDETLLNWAKDLGCNFVRLAHYPHNAEMTRLADRLGLMVWSEVPVYWNIQWNNPATLANAEAQLRDNIARDRNRASVILWSVANETPNEPGRLDFLKQLIDEAHQLDGTRLVTAASNVAHMNGNTDLLDDPLGQYLDVLGWNEYVGWYQGKPADLDTMTWKTTYPKPLIFSEFGAGAVAGNHGDADARWNEEYQADVYRRQIKSLQRIPSLAGMTPWILMDFRSPRRFLPGVQDMHNRKGLISNRGQRKQAFYVLQKFYSEVSKSSQHE